MPLDLTRRDAIGLIAGVPLLAVAQRAGAATVTPAAVRDRVGVCVHLNDTGSAYHDWPRVEACMRFIGLHHMRTAAPQRNTLGYMLMGKAATAGFKFTFTMRHNRPFNDEIADLEAFGRAYKGSIAAIEGPNEIDHSPVSFNGRTDRKEDAYGNPAAALDYQAALWNAIRASAVLKGVPLIAFSDFAQKEQRATYSNTHIYPRNGTTLTSRLPGMHAKLDPAGRAIVITETGFHTLPGAKPFPGTDETKQAQLVRDAVKAAVADPQVVRTYFYELLDSYPPNQSMETHFGLFHYDYSAKRAASVMRQLALG